MAHAGQEFQMWAPERFHGPGSSKARHNQWHREAKARGSHTRRQWEALREYFENRCVCCLGQPTYWTRWNDKTPDLHRDHIVPASRGGSNLISNIQPLCPRCNARKRNHHNFDYRPRAAKALGLYWPEGE